MIYIVIICSVVALAFFQYSNSLMRRRKELQREKLEEKREALMNLLKNNKQD